MLRAPLHMVLHFVVPLLVARAFYRPRWLRAWLILTSTMIVDLDHLLATPVFDPCRCSLLSHPLHSWPAIGAYALLLSLPKLRFFALGLLIHMALDGIDCLWMAWTSLCSPSLTS